MFKKKKKKNATTHCDSLILGEGKTNEMSDFDMFIDDED